MEITISNVGPGDYATLARLFSFLSGTGVVVKSEDAPAKSASPKVARAAKAPAPAAPTIEVDASREDAILEKFSGWHASQKDANGKGRHYTKAQVSHYLPLWNAAKAEYLQAAGSRAASGRTFKSWSINQFKRETAALGPTDSEGSPAPKSPSKRATKKLRPKELPPKRRGRPPGSPNKKK